MLLWSNHFASELQSLPLENVDHLPHSTTGKIEQASKYEKFSIEFGIWWVFGK